MEATMNKETNTPQELKAIKCMEALNIYKPYIDIFKKQKTLCLFEDFAGFYQSHTSPLLAKKQEIEQANGIYIYAMIDAKDEVDEVYILLAFSSDDAEDNPEVDINDISVTGVNEYLVYAYIWNRTNEKMSGLDYVTVKSLCGGLSYIKGE